MDIDNLSTSLSFPQHSTHIESSTHTTWDCTQCHTKPTDALSTGHLFLGDSSAGLAEVAFMQGLSPAGSYTGNGSCSNLYCHGSGQQGSVGSVSTTSAMSCNLCHGDISNHRSLSGEHGKHLEEGIQCGDCHSLTVSGNSTITGATHHVDGTIDVALPASMNWGSGSCTGTCHEENHNNEHWQ